jgi:hypothetical protein
MRRQISAFSGLETMHTGVAPPTQGKLCGVGAETSGGAPHEDHVPLLHAGAVAADQLPVGGAVHQPGSRRLLPGEVRRLGHQLVGLDQGQLGQAAEVGLEAPDPLLRVEHRVVVALVVLELDRQAVRDDRVAGLPLGDAGARRQHDA